MTTMTTTNDDNAKTLVLPALRVVNGRACLRQRLPKEDSADNNERATTPLPLPPEPHTPGDDADVDDASSPGSGGAATLHEHFMRPGSVEIGDSWAATAATEERPDEFKCFMEHGTARSNLSRATALRDASKALAMGGTVLTVVSILAHLAIVEGSGLAGAAASAFCQGVGLAATGFAGLAYMTALVQLTRSGMFLERAAEADKRATATVTRTRKGAA